MGYQAERDQTLIELGRAGFTTRQARALLSLGTTLHRLAEGQCNGDWPWDNGERGTLLCEECGSACVPSALKKGSGTIVADPLNIDCPACGEPAGLPCKRTDTGAVRKFTHRSRGKSGKCPDCRAQDRVRAILAEGPTRPVPLPTGGYPCSCGHAVAPWDVTCGKCGAPEPIKLAPTGPAWVPKFAGDPRGCVCWIYPAGTPEADIENGRARSSGIAIVGRY